MSPFPPSHAGYLRWKITQAQKGRIPVGPRKSAHREGVTFKVLPLRMESDLVDKLDEAWKRQGLHSRMDLLRKSLQAFLVRSLFHEGVRLRRCYAPLPGFRRPMPGPRARSSGRALCASHAKQRRLEILGETVRMKSETTYTAFAGIRRVAAGTLRDVLPVLKERFDRDNSESILVFEVETGRQVDFGLRGSLDEVLEREAPTAPRGPGRPRLGVTSREVSLLPRHWDWLEQQPNGISAAIRRLVEQAIKAQPGQERARRIRAALSQVLSAIAGDRPYYEEACRALFAGDAARLRGLIARWPKDIREYALHQATEADRAEKQTSLDVTANTSIVADLHRLVWSSGDYQAIARLVAPSYVIHSDPGDAWEGRTLDRATYEERVRYSRTAFPDLVFAVHEMVEAGNRVAVRWSAEGTHGGDLHELPATGKRLTFAGQTIYEITDGQVAGHWQVVDRLGFVQQLHEPHDGVARGKSAPHPTDAPFAVEEEG